MAKRVILVGTYWTGQLDRWRGYYNYPVSDKDVISEADCRRVSELWLFKGVSDPRYREAEFVGAVSRKELIEQYGYRPNKTNHAEVIAKEGTKIIRPRVDKSKEEQRERVTKKAEVFTPSWICNAMNNQVDHET